MGNSNESDFSSKFDLFVAKLDSARKLLVSLLIIILSGVLIYQYFKNAWTKQLLVKPFKISSRLQRIETNGETVTSLFIDKIRDIQSSGASMYRDQQVILPVWENSFDEINTAFNNSIFSEAKSLLQYFGSSRVKYATGDLQLNQDSSLCVRFTIEHHAISACGSQNLDSLLTALAEASLLYIDPYTLAAYYLKTGNLKQCAITIQYLLNDNLPENDGLAMHLEGMLHLAKHDTLGAKMVFQKTLQKIKTPWLTFNNLGVIYFAGHQYDSARYFYKKAISANPNAYFGYLNFANVLYSSYAECSPGSTSWENRLQVLDSAIYYYKKAIYCNKMQQKLYIALLPALYARNKVAEFKEYADKLDEMAPDEPLTPLQVGLIYKNAQMVRLADSCFDVARARCMGDSIKIKQLDFYITKKG